MKKINYSLIIGIIAFFSCQKEQSSPSRTDSVQSQNESFVVSAVKTTPVTAVSFPKEVIDVEGGKIEFWAKLKGYKGGITVGGYDPYFFQVHDGTSTFQMGFNSNDGIGNSGLTGLAGYYFACGSGGSTYEKIFGEGNVNKWHCYVFAWNKNGIRRLGDANKKIAIYINGVQSMHSWHAAGQNQFIPLTSGTFNLITTADPEIGVSGEVVMDELKIYDRQGKLILWNTLGSVDEITHSKIGPNGLFNGGGNAHFVTGKSGNAVSATPVGGLGE